MHQHVVLEDEHASHFRMNVESLLQAIVPKRRRASLQSLPVGLMVVVVEIEVESQEGPLRPILGGIRSITMRCKYDIGSEKMKFQQC